MIRKNARPLAALLACAVLALPLCARAEDEAIPVEVERAVDNGIAWLAKSQGRDGSWSAAPNGATVAATALATMAMMARGHVPGQGPYGDNLNRGFDALLSMQAADGLFGKGSNGVMYEHGIATVALCEAYGMLDDKRQDRVRLAISKAVRVILDAQRVAKSASDQGGWRYTPSDSTSDISVSGWQLMALRGASNAGANIPQKAIDDGISYIKRRAVFGGGFSYQSNSGPNSARTGTGVLALSLMGQPDAPEVKAGGDYLIRTGIGAGDGHYFYTYYYCSQAAWQLGDKYWTILNREVSSSLRSRQKADGSWSGGESSDVYCTAMAILALTVPYRYLPIYQR
jgi:prenyltransferase beta subunit